MDISNEYIGKNNRNIYLILSPTDENKETLKFKEVWSKVKRLNRSTNKSSDGYDKKNMKIKFNSNNHLPLIKTLSGMA